MHLLAVSGLHVGIVFLVLTRILSLIGFSAYHSANRIISVLIVWIYVMVCGVPPSAARAAGMISLYVFSSWTGRQVNSIQMVALVCFIHTLIEPAKIFTPGFQLSYLAILGIFIYYPRIRKTIVVRNRILSKVRDLAGISVAAQSLTLPVVLFTFAGFPVYFLIGNIFLMPLGLFVFYFSLLLLILQLMGLNVPFLHEFLDWFMGIWIDMGSMIANLPGNRLIVNDFPFYESFFYLGLLFVLRNGLRKSLLPPFRLFVYLFGWTVVGFLFTICNML